jgi:hypothetical protein
MAAGRDHASSGQGARKNNSRRNNDRIRNHSGSGSVSESRFESAIRFVFENAHVDKTIRANKKLFSLIA